MAEKKNSIKIKDLEIENFKGIDFKSIQIDGRSFVITSKNGTNKSSLMDAIMAAFDSNYIPTVPLKAGQEKGHIKVIMDGEIMGEKKEYTARLSFTQANQKGTLKVFNDKEEEIKSPRGFLDTLLGKIPSPIHSFLRGNRQEDKNRRLKVLRGLTGREQELDILDRDKAEAIKEREKMSGEIKALEAVIYQHGITEEEFQKYMKPTDEAKIQAEMDAVQPTIDKITKFKERYDAVVSEVKSLGDIYTTSQGDNARDLEKIVEYEKEIQKIKDRIAARSENLVEISNKAKDLNDNKIEPGKKWLAENTMPDVAGISSRLQEATHHNNMNKKIEEFQGKQQQLFKMKEEHEKLDVKIKAFDSKKIDIIKNSNLPFKDVSFDDTGIYLTIDGVPIPLEEMQINTAKILEFGEDVCLAMNQNLKVMFVPNASLYDRENLKRVFEKAHAKGFMVIAEVVGEADSPELIWFEDYFKK